MILVTGGTGLVGAHLLLHLVENGDSIRATYRQANTIEKTKSLFQLHQKDHLFSKIDWIEADITDVPSLEIAFQNIDYVYHCAGFISFDPDDEEKLRKINIEGTANIVNFCLAYQIKKLCHVSSIAAFGNVTSGKIHEEAEWNPEVFHSDYAISKYGAEMEVWRAQQEGLQVVMVNPGVILGSTIWIEGSGAIFTKVKNRLKFYTLGETGYVGVKDVVSIMIQLMKSDIAGERFCLVSENLSYQKIINTIAQNLNIPKPNIYAKPWMTAILWKIDWFANTFFRTKRKLSKHAATTIHTLDKYDNHKIKNALNFEFQSIDSVIEEIISRQK
ncbi:NAD-dependent epimerase/dehydratase family protein [Flavobacterium sp. AS60]|uniref:NAD-dependent epimerase/dehydratase family protein n=1 Tax=Flavobacterium anseongense TaxID=2910677 RepID=UPI001F25810A|nr:NAD-dependent epimerase/dehydratase family protein [Flavobacterium sp. AS60]MCF6129254.1 NAD-dependent epimerase/dehydratase family protein [Flavobacterium sp. AS60]